MPRSKREPDDQSVLVTGYQQQLDRLIAEGNSDPLWIMLRTRSSPRERFDAARQVAATMSTWFKNPAVRHLLAGRAGARQSLREVVFPAALLEAAGERFTERRIRLGKRWVKDARGRVANRSPMQLSVPAARRWLIARARTLAEGSIIGTDRSAIAALRRRPSKREEQLRRLLAVPGSSRADAALKMRLTRSTIDTLASRLLSKGWPLTDSLEM